MAEISNESDRDVSCICIEKRSARFLEVILSVYVPAGTLESNIWLMRHVLNPASPETSDEFRKIVSPWCGFDGFSVQSVSVLRQIFNL